MDSQKIDDQVTIGAQPTASDIHALAQAGFRSMVNLRTDGEEDQPLDPEQEREVAQKAGLRYVHLPVAFKNLQPAQFDEFRREMENLRAPVYVHCRGGTRAGVMVGVQRAIEQGQSGGEALEQLQQQGLDRDSPACPLIKEYVDRQLQRGA